MLIESSSCAQEETQNLLRQIHMDRNPIHVPRAGKIFANHHRTVSWLITVGKLPEMPWLKSEKSQPLGDRSSVQRGPRYTGGNMPELFLG